MEKQLILLLIVFLPTIGAFLLPLVGRVSETSRNRLSFLLVAASFILSFALLPTILKGQTIVISKELPLGLNFVLEADGLAVFVAMVSSFISAIIILYSFTYISHYEHRDEYYLMVVLFLGAMMGLVYSGNLILLYVFFEITSITSWRLIGYFREKQHVLKADKAFLITVFGALMMLLGFVSLYIDTGSFDLAVIKQWMQTQNHQISNLTVVLIMAGILSKSATLPFHTWLQDAGVAPSPVTALLHAAVLVKIGVYVFARIFVVTIPLDINWQHIIPVIAGASALIAAGAALIDTDLKRIIAYSTVSQIGFIFLGLSINTKIGIAGGVLFVLMHGLSKAGLFLCAGIVEQNAKTKDITKMGGFIQTMPITAISFLFCGFSVMGLPPFGGFFCKYMVIAGAMNSGQLVIAAVFLFGAVLTILYLFRLFKMVFLGELLNPSIKEGSATMVFCVALFALLSLMGGILVYYPNDIIQKTIVPLIGVIK